MQSLRTVLVLLVLAAVVGPAGRNFVDAQGQQDKDKKAQKDKDKPQAGVVFELYKDTAGEFRFRLKDEFGLLATSGKGYKTKADCQKVIETIRHEAAKAKVDDQTK
jgi:uncharacterized protein YegP (UPF0339 family)